MMVEQRFQAAMARIVRELRPTHFLVGVSGGCDSVALLHLLRHWAVDVDSSSSSSISSPSSTSSSIIRAVHFDHRQRGVESDRDREFVLDLCRQLDVPVECYYWQQQEAKDHKNKNNFSQATARDWRRRTMEDMARRTAAAAATAKNEKAKEEGGTTTMCVILTAHHQDDSEETMLLKLLRGVHLTNIAGLPMIVKPGHQCNDDDDENNNSNHNDITSADADDASAATTTSIAWARPLINLRKREIIHYLHRHNLSWREDGSNESPKYLRNRVRNELIPLLRDLLGDEDDSHVVNEKQDGEEDEEEGALARRLRHIEEQARELRQDLDRRAGPIIDNVNNNNGPYFSIPSSTTALDVVYFHAFHQWAERRGCTIRYEQSVRLAKQLRDRPDHWIWRLQLGAGWDVVRNGAVLRLVDTNNEDGSGDSIVTATPFAASAATIDHRNKNNSLPFTLVPPLLDDKDRRHDDDEATRVDDDDDDDGQNNNNNNNNNNNDAIEVYLPHDVNLATLFFEQVTLADFVAGQQKHHRASFTPPWRHKAVPVKDFLRGQKVPLHQRASNPVITTTCGGGNQIVAILINRGDDATVRRAAAKWVVDANFGASKYDGGDGDGDSGRRLARKVRIVPHAVAPHRR
jgi:tRNA(Ile)-lysidine synthetase-like protein